jgi:hypothetical protein
MGRLITRRVAELREMGMARGDLRRVMAEEDAAFNPLPRREREPEATIRVKVLHDRLSGDHRLRSV